METFLTDKTVLVTGSSSGIGAATALAFGREGANVAVTYKSNKAGAVEIAQKIESSGGQALVVPLDITAAEKISGATDMISKQWNQINVLVNNAVVWPERPDKAQSRLFEDVKHEEWTTTFRNNLEGTYAMIQQVLPFMRGNDWGRIINISSNLAEDGLPGSGAYAAAKAGLHGLTKVLSKELAPDKILTNAVLPGLTLTQKAKRTLPSEILDRIAGETPTGRLTKPEEAASLIVFLGSEANRHINGEIIRITGGL